ncbi:MAG TPA: phospholipase D-like domain-containing protein [Polyangiaceae bacterium]
MTVLLPGPHVDSRVVSIASEPVVRRVVEAGVSVYEFQPTMMHAKVVLVDDDLSAVGSANFNSRSLHKDDEVMVVSSDRDLAARLGRHFERDLESSRLKRREDFEQLPWWRRALAALAAPLRGEM